MADNITITSGTGVTVATDDDGSAQHQYVKVEFGADGAFTKVTNAVPLPISGTTIAITSLPDLGLNSSVKISSLPDLGLNSSVKITSLPDLGLNSVVKITSLPDLGANSFVKITSLPDLGANSAVKITSLPPFPNSVLQVSGTTIAITSLPDIGLGSSVRVSSLPAFAVGAITSISNGAILSVTNLLSITGTVTSLGGTSATQVTISNLASVPLTVSGTTIAVTNTVSVTGTITALGTTAATSVTVSNLANVPLTISGTTIAVTNLVTVSGTTIAITSLPDLGLNSSVKITSLPAFAVGSSVTISNLASVPLTVSISGLTTNILSINNLTVNPSVSTSIGNFPVQVIPAKTFWRFTATQTAAGTVAIKALVASQTAIYITNIVVSNENTAGNFSFIESSTAIAIRPVIERLYLAANGGAVMNFTQPVALDTNTGLFLLTRTVTNHSVFISGYTALEAKSL